MSFENYLPLVDSDQTAALADQEYREHQARFSKQKRRDRLWELPKAVYCSVIGTCVSHNATQKIKIHCARDSTAILYIRRASTSAFLKGLEEAATK